MVVVLTSLQGGVVDHSPFVVSAHRGETAASALPASALGEAGAAHEGGESQFLNEHPEPATLDDSQPEAEPSFWQSASVKVAPELEQLASPTLLLLLLPQATTGMATEMARAAKRRSCIIGERRVCRWVPTTKAAGPGGRRR
jgi:hypothetical protein